MKNLPDKIYIKPLLMEDGESVFRRCVLNPNATHTIEYVRTDAFIEKADEFIGSFFHPDDTKLRNCLLKKFHEYMKGE